MERGLDGKLVTIHNQRILFGLLLDLVLSVDSSFVVQLVGFLCCGISVLFSDTQGIFRCFLSVI